jgi:hypothetical protein
MGLGDIRAAGARRGLADVTGLGFPEASGLWDFMPGTRRGWVSGRDLELAWL